MSNKKETVIHTKTATFTIIKNEDGSLMIIKTMSEYIDNNIIAEKTTEDSVTIY